MANISHVNCDEVDFGAPHQISYEQIKLKMCARFGNCVNKCADERKAILSPKHRRQTEVSNEKYAVFFLTNNEKI